MKKAILIISAVGISFSGMAQEKYVVSANVALNAKNYDEAKENIDKAMASPDTKEKPKALFSKAQVYYALQNTDKYRSSNPYREAAQAAIKLVEVKPDFEKNSVDQLLLSTAYMYFNDGVRAGNDKKFDEATELMRNVVKIHDLGGGKRFDKRTFDTVSAQATMTIANAAYYSGKYEESIPLLVNVKNNPITKTATVYECLIDAYTRTKNSAEAFAMITEARKYFPEDVTLRNYELNYYIMSGKQDELLKKLEEAASKEPDNSDIQFNLATTYLGMANPKDGKKPVNAADLTTKSESAFTRALAKAPENAGYNYNFGALYFNQATEVNDQMNAVTGSSAADLKKYDELKAKRDGLFGKSMPYFEKSLSVLAARESDLKGEDMKTYKSTLLALKEVYARQSKMDKSMEMKKKYESLK
ncbi:MAG: hypothetical protein JWQ38_3419 [Flavipsychrobacter sp.]|nr:hypothetical protein [Flavipsychrobacter sp.]